MRTSTDWLASLSPEELAALRYDWRLRARPEQLLPDGDWRGCLFQAGRGWGKTLAGVEALYDLHAKHAGFISHVVAPTAGDLLKVTLFGPSGFMSVRPAELQPRLNKNEMTLTWPGGGRTLLFSAEEPARLRGPECDFAWFDELAYYRDPERVFDNAMFGLRRGMSRFLVTTTPAPMPMLRRLREMPGVVVRQGSSTENRALSPAYAEILARYRGTRKERQEVFGEFLEDNPGALDGWNEENFNTLRVGEAPSLRRVFVGVDPATTSTETSDETGIVAVGQGEDNHAYVLADSSGRHQPQTWARLAVALYHQLRANAVIAEGNNGGDLVSAVIANVDANVPVKIVHATRGKAVRAEPVSLWFHQRRAHLVGLLPELENELASFDPDLWEQGRQASPGRLDAMVWAFNPFVEGPSDTLGLVDFLAGVAAGTIADPTRQVTQPKADGNASVCPTCGAEGLMQKIAGGQVRCGACGGQFGQPHKATHPWSRADYARRKGA